MVKYKRRMGDIVVLSQKTSIWNLIFRSGNQFPAHFASLFVVWFDYHLQWPLILSLLSHYSVWSARIVIEFVFSLRCCCSSFVPLHSFFVAFCFCRCNIFKRSLVSSQTLKPLCLKQPAKEIHFVCACVCVPASKWAMCCDVEVPNPNANGQNGNCISLVKSRYSFAYFMIIFHRSNSTIQDVNRWEKYECEQRTKGISTGEKSGNEMRITECIEQIIDQTKMKRRITRNMP